MSNPTMTAINALTANGQSQAVEREAAVPGGESVWIDYTNYRGERSWRHISPASLVWSSNEWHPEPQWLLYACDHEKNAERIFAMRDIHAWSATPAAETAPDAGLVEALRDAADEALNVLIGCTVSAGGVDDRAAIARAKQMLRAALSRAGERP